MLSNESVSSISKDALYDYPAYIILKSSSVGPNANDATRVAELGLLIDIISKS